MKAFLTSVVVAIVVSVAAAQILPMFQSTAPAAFTTEGARITSPGDNLVQF
jgi:hypothetical protein